MTSTRPRNRRTIGVSRRQATKLGAELLAEGSVVSLGLAVLFDSHRREAEAEEFLEARIAALEAALVTRASKGS